MARVTEGFEVGGEFVGTDGRALVEDEVRVGSRWARCESVLYLPRNATSAGFFAFSWDGTRLHSAGVKPKTKVVPDGEYCLVVSILNALGDTGNPAHWETSTTPVFEIDRP